MCTAFHVLPGSLFHLLKHIGTPTSERLSPLSHGVEKRQTPPLSANPDPSFEMHKALACLVLLLVALATVSAQLRAKRAINPFLDSMGKRAVNPFIDSIGKRAFRLLQAPEKKYFDSLAGQSLGKRSEYDDTEPFF
ncbi:unnamed protein product [Caenorhabditis auriculariae]|uniref:Uncharacterized protein n=1 Tax=Caenorhabditis auriculariae TaxID=2777116 RepID=A0A8S1HVJ1_9PELO|nr:unnamed protein product [Caenorhabditis auriculariae]